MTHTAGNDTTHTILDSIADGVFTVDKQWQITSFNRAAETITGVPRAEALGQRCCDVFRASICENACALNETFSTGRPVVNRVVYIITAEGERVPISVSTAVLKDDRGAVIGGVETFRDLTLVEALRKEISRQHTFADMIGHSHAMRRLFETLPAVASSPSTALILGETGTGKELLARAVHSLSPRGNGPFVAVNCGALPEPLLESELFGYKAGAFTGAGRDKPGRFALAEGGTIFLDEIGELSTSMQVRLLRVLQERTYEPLGARQSETADVRVVVATHRDLEARVRSGEFREDLYYRINVVRLILPPLRDRKEDIPFLVEAFITRFNRLQEKDIQGVTPDVLSLLMHHDWPGNIRELENVIERCFVLCNEGLITVAHLPEELTAHYTPRVDTHGIRATRDLLEAKVIQDTLIRNGYNRAATARELGVHKSTLYRRMKRLGISLPEEDGRGAGE